MQVSTRRSLKRAFDKHMTQRGLVEVCSWDAPVSPDVALGLVFVLVPSRRPRRSPVTNPEACVHRLLSPLELLRYLALAPQVCLLLVDELLGNAARVLTRAYQQVPQLLRVDNDNNEAKGKQRVSTRSVSQA